MKKMILLIALCCVTVCSNVMAAEAAGNNASNEKILISSSGKNISINDTGLAPSNLVLFGPLGFNVANAIKFEAPKEGWKLHRVGINAWDGFNGSRSSMPVDMPISLEVRDENLNLLYRFTDVQSPYFNFALNRTEAVNSFIDLPAVPVTKEFYIMFYDRGAVNVGIEIGNATGNSFFFNRLNKELQPAQLPINETAVISINWLAIAAGE